MPLVVLLAGIALSHQDSPIQLTEGLGISKVSRGGRVPFPVDLVGFQINAGNWSAPKDGDAMPGIDGQTQTWHKVTADKDGNFSGPEFEGGYCYITYSSPTDGEALLQAPGCTLAYVNGIVRSGDPYGYGSLLIPVRLRAGENSLLFSCGRGGLNAKLLPAAGPSINSADATTPDLVVGDKGSLSASVVVINPSDEEGAGWKLQAEIDGVKTTTNLPVIPAQGIRKVGFSFPVPKNLEGKSKDLRVRLFAPRMKSAWDEKTLSVRIRQPNETQKRTFISAIDGSVQYYAVNPAQKPAPTNVLVLTLHGASVEALGQAEAYASKDWAWIVAPTNRRPFGFDWEDWGRLDAMEVLDIAKKTLPHDQQRVMLTGHSMGGHGSWTVGTTFPDQFAVIGPSAGWISFSSYAGGWEPKDPTPVEQLLRRSANGSDTLLRKTNLLRPEIYGIHGDADDNVPVEQLRTMKAELEKIGKSIQVHEEPGAGHWWDKEGPGADCVDWKPLFNLFQTTLLPQAPTSVDFSTVNPAVSATYDWLRIDQQEHPLELSRAQFALKDGALTGTTENIQALTLDYGSAPIAGMPLTIDGQMIPVPRISGRVTFVKHDGKWTNGRIDPWQKNAERSGPFKQAFRKQMMFVYGTRGTAEENSWAYQKARYDAETFEYRGNGSIDVIPDREFNLRATKDRSVILYGNSDTNSAWKQLLADCPIQVSRNAVRVGDKSFSQADLFCLFLRPRKDSATSMVGVVSGTGMAGCRSTNRLPFFTSGVAYPDWTVGSNEIWQNGAKGVLGAGFFDNDWNMSAAESAWR